MTGRAGGCAITEGQRQTYSSYLERRAFIAGGRGAEAADNKVVDVVAPLDACRGRRRRYKNRCSVAMGDRQRRRPVHGRVTTRVRSKARVCALQGPKVFQTYLTRPANRRSKPTSHPPPPHTTLRTLSKPAPRTPRCKRRRPHHTANPTLRARSRENSLLTTTSTHVRLPPPFYITHKQ